MLLTGMWGLMMDAERWTSRYRDPARWAETAADRASDALTQLFNDAYTTNDSPALPANAIVRAG